MHSSKAEDERKAFAKFAHRIGERHDWHSVISRPAPEPDLLCTHAFRGTVAFELVRITDPSIAEIQAAGVKAKQGAFSTADPTEKIIRAKLKKRYGTPHPMELLIYTGNQVITPEDSIRETVVRWANAVSHPFRKIWFMGQNEAGELWSAT